MPEDELITLAPAVVTGEAVVLELRPASPLTRGLAFALDAVVLVLVLLGVLLGGAVLEVGALDDADAQRALGLASVVGVLVGLPTLWESLTRGRSPGKAAAGLRVVRDDGGPVRVRHAVIRSLVGFAEVWTTGGSVALIATLVSPRGKRVGDLLAGTVVVRERSTSRPLRPLVVRADLVEWVRAADIGPVPDDVARHARTVLGRAGQLAPSSRERLVADLAARVLPLVAPPPPPWAPREAALEAVLVERSWRERGRLERARQRRDALAEQSRRLQGW